MKSDNIVYSMFDTTTANGPCSIRFDLIRGFGTPRVGSHTDIYVEPVGGGESNIVESIEDIVDLQGQYRALSLCRGGRYA